MELSESEKGVPMEAKVSALYQGMNLEKQKGVKVEVAHYNAEQYCSDQDKTKEKDSVGKGRVDEESDKVDLLFDHDQDYSWPKLKQNQEERKVDAVSASFWSRYDKTNLIVKNVMNKKVDGKWREGKVELKRASVTMGVTKVKMDLEDKDVESFEGFEEVYDFPYKEKRVSMTVTKEIPDEFEFQGFEKVKAFEVSHAHDNPELKRNIKGSCEDDNNKIPHKLVDEVPDNVVDNPSQGDGRDQLAKELIKGTRHENTSVTIEQVDNPESSKRRRSNKKKKKNVAVEEQEQTEQEPAQEQEQEHTHIEQVEQVELEHTHINIEPMIEKEQVQMELVDQFVKQAPIKQVEQVHVEEVEPVEVEVKVEVEVVHERAYIEQVDQVLQEEAHITQLEQVIQEHDHHIEQVEQVVQEHDHIDQLQDVEQSEVVEEAEHEPVHGGGNEIEKDHENETGELAGDDIEVEQGNVKEKTRKSKRKRAKKKNGKGAAPKAKGYLRIFVLMLAFLIAVIGLLIFQVKERSSSCKK